MPLLQSRRKSAWWCTDCLHLATRYRLNVCTSLQNLDRRSAAQNSILGLFKRSNASNGRMDRFVGVFSGCRLWELNLKATCFELYVRPKVFVSAFSPIRTSDSATCRSLRVQCVTHLAKTNPAESKLPVVSNRNFLNSWMEPSPIKRSST